MEVYKNILDFMTQKGITKYRLGKECSIDTKQFHQWEHGKAKPSIDTLEKIANYFDISTDFLFGRTDNPKAHKTENYYITINPIIPDIILENWDKLDDLTKDLIKSTINAYLENIKQ